MGDILFMAHRVPWPPNRGDKIRSYHFLRKLTELASVHLVCFADDVEESEKDDILRGQLASCNIVVRGKPQWKAGIEALASRKPVSVTSFGSKQLETSVQSIIAKNEIQCIFVFSGQMAQFVPVNFNGRFVMDFADVDSAKFETYGTEGFGPMAWINRREGKILKDFEKQIGEQADQSLFVSAAEATLFRNRTGLNSDKVIAIGNGIDLEFYDQTKVEACEASKGPLIVFTGQMDYRPNVEAVQSFANEAMPIIIEKHPDAQFAIVGRAPADAVKALDGKNGVVVTGAVPDIRKWLKAADAVVAPLRIARGIQNKVLEAMAMGKPVVASTAAAEGISAKNGEHFLVAKDVAEEAELVSQLISDKDMALKLGNAAQLLIRSQYSWDSQISDLASICDLDLEELLEAAQ